MFGLNPADHLMPGAAPKLWWGARAIYKPDAKLTSLMIELLPDRQQFNHYEKACVSLASWINRRGLGKLRKELRLNFVAPDADRLVWVVDKDFNLIANPKASYGYLYLAAWRNEACPAPETESSSSSQPA